MGNLMYGTTTNAASATNVIREQFTDPLTHDKYTILANLKASVHAIRQLPGSREASLSITNLEQAIMWLEKA